MTDLYIVCQNTGPDSFSFSGVFDTKEAAIDACRDEDYWWALVPLNFQFPHEHIVHTDPRYFKEWGYPKADKP